MHITIAALPLARLCRFSISLQRCIGSSLQPCHWSDVIALVPVYSLPSGQTLLHWFQLAVLTLVKLYFIVSVCSPAACQTLFHWFQFTAVPPVRLYCIGSSLQPYHWSDFITVVGVGSPDACQTLIHAFSLQSCRLSDFISLVSVGVLPFTIFDLSRFSLQPAYICTEIYNSESYHVVWLCPSGPWPNAHYNAALPSARIYFTRSKMWPDWPEISSLGPRCDLLIGIPNILLKPYKGTHQSDYYLAVPELLYDQMPKTHPTRRSRHAKASEGPPDDRTMPQHCRADPACRRTTGSSSIPSGNS